MGTCSVVLSLSLLTKSYRVTIQTASSAVILHAAICFSIFYKMQFGSFLKFCFLVLLGVERKLSSSLIAMRGGSVCRLRKIMLESFHLDYKGDS